jgi:hypothetical protein
MAYSNKVVRTNSVIFKLVYHGCFCVRNYVFVEAYYYTNIVLDVEYRVSYVFTQSFGSCLNVRLTQFFYFVLLTAVAIEPGTF